MVWISKPIEQIRKPTLKEQVADLLRSAKESGRADYWFSRKGLMVALNLEPMEKVDMAWQRLEGTTRTNYYKVRDALNELIREGKINVMTETRDLTYAYAWR